MRVDGTLLERTAFVGLMAGTVREVGLGFKLVHRADDDPERFGVLAMHSPPLSLALDLWAVQRGRGHRAAAGPSARWPRRWTFTRRTAPWPTRSTATSTGRTSRSSISLGPPILFVKPPSALIVRAARRYHGRPAMSTSFPSGRDEGAVRRGLERGHEARPQRGLVLPARERTSGHRRRRHGRARLGRGRQPDGGRDHRRLLQGDDGRPAADLAVQDGSRPPLRRQPHGHRHQARQPQDPRAGAEGPALPRHGDHRGVDAVPRSRADRRARRRQPAVPAARRRHEAAHRGSLAAQRLHQDEEPLAPTRSPRSRTRT